MLRPSLARVLHVIATFESEAFFGDASEATRILVDRVDVEPYLELVFVLESRAGAVGVAADLSIALVALAAGGDVACPSTSLRLTAANVRSGVATATIQQPAVEMCIESRWFPRCPKDIAPIRGVLYGRIASPQP